MSIVILIAAIAGTFCRFKMTKYKDKEKFTVEPSLNGMKNIAFSAVLSDNIEITDNELNGIISWWLKNSDNTGILKNTAVYFNNENKVEIYGSFIYLERELSFWLSGKVIIKNDNICFEAENCKIGELSIPIELVMYILQSKLPENITCQDNIILFPCKYDLKIFGTEYTLGISEFSCTSGKCTLHI